MLFAAKFHLYAGLQHQNEQLSSNNLMSYFDCNPNWPICLFDFTFKSKLPTYLCYRVAEHLDKLIIKDYFFSKSNESPTQYPVCGLLVERQPHICGDGTFVEMFKNRFELGDESMIRSPVFIVF
jgi:hypothetical protein